MRAIGCVRQIDKLGRLVLPADIRKSLNIVDGVDSVEFFVDDDSVIIKKYRPSCVFCNSAENIVNYKNQTVCQSCLDELRNGK
ncbi:MAG: AbrB/MazE/SpoVT family DNA-binding domain-containing protein [Clostridia bacterium]|nr:AbrB/MazE/SpoVT family DNA-binding domain-containing protein [Clostridia bacterium]